MLLGVGCPLSACQRSPGTDASATDDTAQGPASLPFGGLHIETAGDLADTERGGTTVVLLHGFGASGDDLLPLARDVAHARTRYVAPAGPLELPNGGRAWWSVQSKPVYDAEQVLHTPKEKLEPARLAVVGLLRTIHQRFAPDALFLVGFSQGAMLALDVALIAAASVTRVAVLSGALLDDAAQRLATRPAHPAVFVAHGRQDKVLAFAGAEHLVEALRAHKLSVTFRPFDGGHEITPAIVADLKAFLATELE